MQEKKNQNRQENKLLIYGMYTKLIESIKHYDGIQNTYRSLSSTLLLAAFVGIGFLFSSQGNASPIQTLLAVIFICLIVIGALTVFCLLDLVFQERLLIANLYEALKLEKQHQWLPQVHHYMLYKDSHFSDPCKKAIFYIGCSSCLFILIGFFLSYFLSRGFVHLSLIIFCVAASIFLYSQLIKRITGKLQAFISDIKKMEKNYE